MDAQRKELSLARYVCTESGLQRQDENCIITVEKWLAELAPGTIVTGQGLAKLEGGLPPHAIVVESTKWEPQATTIGRLALAEHRRGRRDDLWKLAPAYLRVSAAEEKAAHS
jgi:hypothetical protein